MHYLKIITLVFGVLGFFNSHAQTDAVQYADSISSVTGIPYMNMFGTKLLIPKPKNYAIRRKVNLMEIFNDSAELIAEVNIMELPVYETITEPASGAVPFSIHGATGKLFKGSNNEVNSLTFLSSDTESKLYIEISFVGGDKEIEEQYINTLKNIRYDKNIKIHTELLPFIARFTVDLSSTGYGLVGISRGAYTYSANGRKPKSMSESQMWIKEYNTANISELKQLDLPAMPSGVRMDSVVQNLEEPTIDGFKVYTIYMYFGVAPNQLMVYQTVRTNGTVSVVITGTATSDFEKHRALFAKIGESIRVRGGNEIKLFTN